MSDGKAWFQAEKDGIRRRLFKYTRRAFDMIPRTDTPRILDAGCGSGVTAIELAKLADCKITCMDIDREILDVLREKVEQQELGERIEVVEGSILEMNFPDKSFDIILAEGSISAVGFENGLRDWKRFLKPGGFMLIHDSQSDTDNKLKAVPACGYELVDYFPLGTDIWKDEYFIPLDRLIKRAEREFGNDPETALIVDEARREEEMFRQNPYNNSSVCFIIRKTG